MRLRLVLTLALFGMFAVAAPFVTNQSAWNQRKGPVVVQQMPWPPPECGLYDVCSSPSK